MKKLLGIIAFAYLAAASVTGWAEDESMGTCEELYSFAVAVMQERQRGASLPNLMRGAEGDSFLQNIISDAYRQPRVTHPVSAQIAVTDFAERYYLRCHQLFGDGQINPEAW